MPISARMQLNHMIGQGPQGQPLPPPAKFRDKLESDRFIMSSGMNYTPFHLVANVNEVKAALENIRARRAYPISIRFKGRGMQPFKPNLTVEAAYDFCVRHFEKDPTPLGLYEATEWYDHLRQWNGEIQLQADGYMNAHFHPRSKGMKMRDALAHPDAQHVRGVSWDYKPLRWAVDYLCRFGADIIGPVVELSAFEQPVGVKDERIVIWEVRNF